MPFLTDERSVRSSAPIEVYEITSTEGTYRYTSYLRDVTFGGHSYTAVPLARSAAPAAEEVSGELTITTKQWLPFVADNLHFFAQGVTLLITRIQASGASQVIWNGTISGVRAQGDGSAEIMSQSGNGQALATDVPSAFFQQLCNHAFTDEHCRIPAIGTLANVEITGHSGRTVTIDPLGNTVLAGRYTAGKLKLASGEVREILLHEGTSAGDDIVLTLNMPFKTLTPNEPAEMYLGCDHTIETCADRYGNAVNFGGHPFVPVVNLFRVSLRGY